MHLGGAITDISRTSGVPSWKRGLLQMDNINFVDVIWFGTLACIKFIVSLKKRRAFIRENPIEKKTILEAWPCLRLELNFIKGKLFHYVGSDEIFIVSPGELVVSWAR